MFVRAKKIKNALYAYKVENHWTPTGARQKVTGYLGRIVVLEQERDISFADFLKKPLDAYLAASSPRVIIKDLASWVLFCHGFEKDGKAWKKADVLVELGGLRFTCKGRQVVLKIGSDFMCRLTLGALSRFRSEKDQAEVARELATAFVAAGIAVPEEVFIDVFQKVHKGGQSYVY